tara:strand:- start:273 stop:521 length:249 start_codon:yes stop_codon:yes gene_type:complete
MRNNDTNNESRNQMSNLNQAARHLVANGIKIENTTAGKNAVITICIATLIEAGYSSRDAVNIVCGRDAFTVMAGEIYDTLNN